MTEQCLNKKKKLKRYIRIGWKIRYLEDKLSEIDSRITGPRAQRITDMPRGGMPSVTIDDLLTEKDETLARIGRLRTQRSNLKKNILHAFDDLDDVRHTQVLEKFFIEDLRHEEIAEEIGMDVRNVKKIYIKALEALDLEDFV